MNLVKTKLEEIKTLMTWFPDKESSYFWGGPGLRYPFTDQTFLEDMKWEEMPSYSLINSNEEFVGFGQYYSKLGRCHLARLIISPFYRSKGIGRDLIKQLMKIGMEDFNSKECSLFVLNANERALKCYKSLGFKIVKYPSEKISYSDISFMVSKGA